MSMKKFWLDISLKLALREADLFVGARKVVQAVRFDYIWDAKTVGDLKMEDAGFTKSKMSMLIRNYYLEASVKAAQMLWKERLAKKKYGSVGFSCYAHFVKGDVGNHTKMGSKFGPCIQAVTLTYHKKRTTVDVYYRSTELFKKFPADLVFLRDVLLPKFNFKEAPIDKIRFYAANVSVHSMYWVTLAPHLDEPLEWLDRIRKQDPFFWKWCVSWSARYLCPEYCNGIQKFMQAMRTCNIANRDIDKKKLRILQKYLRKHHPKKDKATEETDDD